jgi:hypothetical protein
MSRALVPPPNRSGLGLTGNDGLSRVEFRLWQILMAGIALSVSGWFCTMGVIPAIITVFITKHVIVAIVVAGLEAPGDPKA